MGEHVQYLTQRSFIFIKTVYILTMTLFIKMHYTSHHRQIIKNLYILNTEVLYIYQNSSHSSSTMTLLRCTTSYCNKPKGCFVCWRYVPPDILFHRTFCLPDILSLPMFCPSGGFVPTDVLSHGPYVSGCYVAGRFISGRFVPPSVFSPDILSGHT